ncbi:biotin/lipoyl-binding protein [Aliidiomarina quisquiliarum]|uniref:biotin/lipoyl-binding protein n=1 Tax=Aliidiomarina quisquiliarum TaxID=2938947 RepID=UPI00208DF47C|nr:biotin/lipoyl-binding protein [Aliidiomarina quisquiliarum]MCO4322240.1 biotin/lipoyl-binding protein [Aliidiomarina quisquiliarum]
MLTNKKIALTAAFICVLAIFIAIVWWLWPQPHAELLHGEVEVREIRLASKVAGRVSALYVQEGDKVQAGQLLFELASPELNAKLALTFTLMALGLWFYRHKS